MKTPRNAYGDAYSNLLFKSRFPGQMQQPGDGDPDFNDGLMTPHGAPASYSGIEEGFVVTSYPERMTVDVETDTGSYSSCRIGSTYISPLGAGHSVVPEPGSHCLLCTSVNPAVILCFIAEGDADVTGQDNSKIDAITCGTKGFGGQDAAYVGQGGTNHRAGRSDQLIPGDQVFDAPEGNLVGILRGLSVVKGSELSQLIMSNLGGLVRLVSNMYEHLSAAGVIQIYNQDGKASMVLRAGATSRENGEVEPTVHVSAGAEGDMFELLITSEDGEKRARIHLGALGDTDVETNDLDVEVNKDADISVDGDVEVTVDGDATLTVGGAGSYNYNGKFGLSANELDLRSGGTGRIQTSGDLGFAVAGRFTQQITGSAEIRSGKYNHEALVSEISIAVKGGPLKLAGLTLSQVGDIDLTGVKSATLGGKVSTTVTGLSVQLGDGGGLPVIRNTDLGSLVDAIFAYINASAVVAGPTVKIPAPPGPANPISAIIAALGSKIVKAS